MVKSAATSRNANVALKLSEMGAARKLYKRRMNCRVRILFRRDRSDEDLA